MQNNILHKILIILFFSSSLSACNQIAQVTTPKCSDESTLKLVREIISENFVDKDNQLSPEELQKRLSLTLVHATKLEENIRKYSCEATVTATNGTAEHQMNISFESQLDDDRNHLVKVLNISALDAQILNTLLSRQDVQQSSSENSTNRNDAETVNDQPTDSSVPDELEAALEETNEIFKAQFATIDSTANLKYADARTILKNEGFEPDIDSDIGVYPDLVAGDKAKCGMARCAIPWRSDYMTICMVVSSNDNLSQEEWITGKAQLCDQIPVGL